MKKRFKKIRNVELFQWRGNGKKIMIENPSDWVLWISAIPIIGTLMILLYFLVRKKEIYYEEIKGT